MARPGDLVESSSCRRGTKPFLALAFLLLLGGAAAPAGAADPVEQAESLTRDLMTLKDLYRQAGGWQRERFKQSISLAASLRGRILAELMEERPGEVLRLAIPEAHRAGLPAEVQDLVEEEVETEGEVEVLHACLGGASRLLYTLDVGGERFSLHFAKHPPVRFQTGDRILARGVRVDQAIAIESGDTSVEALDGAGGAVGGGGAVTAPLVTVLPNSFGEHKVAVILVNFTDKQLEPYTAATARDVTFTTTSNYYREVSFGQTWLTGDVFGWYTIPVNSTTTDYSLIASKARAAATADGVNLSAYTNHVIAFPQVESFSWWGLGSIGGRPATTWINGSYQLRVVAHELGHNYGLYHAHAKECGAPPIGSNCSTMDYGDLFDVMGSSSGHFNAFQKERLGWLNYGVSPPLTVVLASGTFTVAPYETADSLSKALKIPTSQGTSYYVEFRRAIGFDNFISSNQNVLNGVLIHTGNNSDPNSSFILDMTSTSSWSDPALTAGLSFQDPAAQVTITTLSAGASGATISISVGGTPPPCAPAAPGIALAPAEGQWVPPGTAVTFGVSVTSKDGPSCAVEAYDLTAAAPAGWSAVLSPPSLSLAAGAVGTASLVVTSPASAAGGFYSINLTAAHRSNGALQASAPATYVVATATGPVVADDFNRPDSTILGGGWMEAAGDLQVSGLELRNAAAAGNHLAVLPGLQGPTQDVSADFASVNNNLGPAFCLLLRYQDPGNHYKIYRSVGGSSTLRISRVVGGVETLLRSVSLSNPQSNIFFRLGAKAQGTRLSVMFNGIEKAFINDATFPGGSVGLMFANGKGTNSHRADNFSATAQ